jgi:uncharacterized membrane protein YoaT (DUF817 family)
MQRALSILRPLVVLWHFAYHEAASCVFPGLIFAMFAFTRVVEIPGLPRYDFLLLGCILVQAAMVWWWKVETVDELKTITVNLGSWAYPGEAHMKVFGVPLFAGFMYASVGSYITQAWRRLGLRVEGFPPSWVNWTFVLLIYANFYTNAFFYDLRWPILAGLLVAYWHTRVYFTVYPPLAHVGHPKASPPDSLPAPTYWMPVLLGFFLVGLFIWFGENLGTFLSAWQYPNQAGGWQLVPPSKLSSWFLLFIVSFVLVAQLKRVKARRGGEAGF